jgi:DNA-binding CsgD family transcriptional regulator/tetratricopeptide (TPR) repeat protein
MSSRTVGTAATDGLAGRQAELLRLRSAHTRSMSGSCAVVEVVGDPGMGKSRALTDLARYARQSGSLVLIGRATEFEHQVPFGLLTDAIEDHLDQVPHTRLAALTEAETELLRTVFPALPGPGSGTAARELIAAERYRLHRALRALLEALAVPDSLVLIFDDLHWADEASAELLTFLLRHPPRGRVLFAVAHRPRQLDGRLRHALTATEAAALLPDGLSTGRRTELYDASGGNPLYLLALAKTFDGAAPGRRPGSVSLPDRVWAAFSAELAGLSPADLTVAQAAAVAGETADPELIAAVADSDPDLVHAALDRITRRDLLRPVPHSTGFQFRHSVVRSVTYESAPAGWRIAAHTRAAFALRARGAPAVDRANHIVRSAAPGDSDAVEVLREAAFETMHTTPGTAALWLTTALRLLPSDPATTHQRVQLLGLYAEALAVTGEMQGSRDALQELLRLLPDTLDEFRARIAVLAAIIERILGREAEADAFLRTELAALGEQASPAALAMKAALAAGAVLRSDATAARRWMADVLADAGRTAGSAQYAAALALSVMADHLAGEPHPDAAARLDRAAEVLDAMPDGDIIAGLELVGWIGAAELAQERIPDAIRHLERVLAVARVAGRAHVMSHHYGLLGSAHAFLGDLARTTECFDNEYDAAQLTGSVGQRGTAMEHQCWLALWRGDLALALQLGKEALTAAETGGYEPTWSSIALLAQAHLVNRDPNAAADLLLSAGDRPRRPTTDPVSRIRWFETMAAVRAAQGDAAAAASCAEDAERMAAQSLLRRTRGYAALARAHAQLAADPGTAVDPARTAAAVLTEAGDRIAAGRAHHVAGNALAAIRDTDSARQEFARARTFLAAAEAPLLLSEVVRDERRMNARRPRPGGRRDGRGGGVGALTPRELEVAKLVAEGLTNKEIAQRLFLSVGTVGIHVGRVYEKLGVSRRAAVAASLANLEA